jgi:hypothetical protein
MSKHGLRSYCALLLLMLQPAAFAGHLTIVLPYEEIYFYKPFHLQIYSGDSLLLTSYEQQFDLDPGWYRVHVGASHNQELDTLIRIRHKEVVLDLSSCRKLRNRPDRLLNSISDGDTLNISFCEGRCFGGPLFYHGKIVYHKDAILLTGTATAAYTQDTFLIELSQEDLNNTLFARDSIILTACKSRPQYTTFYISNRKFYNLTDYGLIRIKRRAVN